MPRINFQNLFLVFLIYSTSTFAKGTLKVSVILTEPTVVKTSIGAVKVQAGEVQVWTPQGRSAGNDPNVNLESGTLAKAEVAEDVVFGKVFLEKGTTIEFPDPNARDWDFEFSPKTDLSIGPALFSASETVLIPGQRVAHKTNSVAVWAYDKVGGKLIPKPGQNLIVEGHLKSEVEVSGVPLAANLPDQVVEKSLGRAFHEQRTKFLVTSVSVRTQSAIQLKMVRVLSGFLSKHYEWHPAPSRVYVQNIVAETGDEIVLLDPTRFKDIILVNLSAERNVTSGRDIYPASGKVWYDSRTGCPVSLTLSKDAAVNGMTARAHREISFSFLGRVSSAVPIFPQKVQGIEVLHDYWQPIYFWESGKILLAVTEDQSWTDRLGLKDVRTMRLAFNPAGELRVVDSEKSIVSTDGKSRSLNIYYLTEGAAGKEKVTKQVDFDFASPATPTDPEDTFFRHFSNFYPDNFVSDFLEKR